MTLSQLTADSSYFFVEIYILRNCRNKEGSVTLARCPLLSGNARADSKHS